MRLSKKAILSLILSWIFFASLILTLILGNAYWLDAIIGMSFVLNALLLLGWGFLLMIRHVKK